MEESEMHWKLGQEIVMELDYEKDVTYVDAGFEQLVRAVEARINDTRHAVQTSQPTIKIMSNFKELCREVRKAKIDFRRVVRFYGATYADSAMHFVELVHCAAEMSKSVDYPEVQKALQRHADEVDTAQSQMKSVA
jgi:hypothetical protein